MLGSVFNKSIVLMLLTAPLLVTSDKEAEERFKSSSDLPAKHKDDETGESRASGGILSDPGHHPWLGTAWSKQKYNKEVFVPGEQRHIDGFMMGHSIALPGEHHILHKDTGRDIINTGHAENGFTNLKQYSWAQHPAEAKVNVLHGPQTDSLHDISLPKHIKDLGNSPFALFNHNKGDYKEVPYPNGKPVTKFPTFEHDKNNFGTDCHAHIWSSKPKNLGGSRSASLDSDRATDRYHVKIPVSVKKDNCNSEGHCQLEASTHHMIGGSFCPGTADRGAPVLCGKEQKLTYLLSPPNVSGGSSCARQVSGYHVGHLIPHINTHDSKLLG